VVKEVSGMLKNKMIAFLTFLKLCEHGKLSITNLGVLALLGKMIVSPSLDWPTAATLLLALLSYNHKKLLAAKAQATVDTASADLDKVKKEILDLTQAFNFKNLR